MKDEKWGRGKTYQDQEGKNKTTKTKKLRDYDYMKQVTWYQQLRLTAEGIL